MGWVFTLLVVAAAVTWIVRRGRETDGLEPQRPRLIGPGDVALASVTFEDGALTSTRGRMPRHALNAFLDVASMSGVTGTVHVGHDRRLRFAGEIDEGVRQQFLNVWHASQGR